MSDYRRLISYIYEYEGKEKGKNVGFVKLESRNGQCRMNLSVKKVYVGGNAIGVYLLNKNGGEAFLGNIFIRNGIGEFRATVDIKNVEGNGDGLDTYYGLTVHDVKNAWRSYTTIWEDAVAPVTQIAEAKDVLPGIGEIKTSQTISRVVKEIEEEITRDEALTRAAEVGAAAKASVFPAVESLEDTVKPQESRALPEEPSVPRQLNLSPEEDQGPRAAGTQTSAPCPLPSAVRMPESGPGGPVLRNSESGPSEPVSQIVRSPEPALGEPVSQAVRSPEPAPGGPISKSPEPAPGGPISRSPEPAPGEPVSRAARMPGTVSGEPFSPVIRAPGPVSCQPVPASGQILPTLDLPRPPVTAAAPARAMQPSAGVRPSAPSAGMPKAAGEAANTNHSQEEPVMRSPELENPEVLKYLQETEDLSADPEKLWQELRKSYPKIQPFDHENGCEILTIRPQDIGRLPRESWIYGNNSFLLHGYYNFRYLILVRLGGKNGNPRYLIGVPGHYYSNEKYMASMFGFPNFVLSKKQPSNDGRFGYWYTDIKIR